MARKYHKRVAAESGAELYRKHQPGPCTVTQYRNGQPLDSYVIPAENLQRTKYLEFTEKVRPTTDTGATYPRWSKK